MLFTLRFRKPYGVATSLIEAKDFATAEHVGKVYCEREPGYRYISVEQAVVADESILKPEDVKKPARVGA